MKKSEKHNLESGFTLIEVLIALTIFAVGLLALASMQIMSIRGNSTSQRITCSTAAAEGVMEWLLSLPANHTLFDADEPGAPVDNPPFDANGKLSLEGGGELTLTYSIDTTPPLGTGATSFPGSVVQIKVSADSSVAGARDVELTSIKWVR